jgi:predicted NBD/HSP70 family sugar kinase
VARQSAAAVRPDDIRQHNLSLLLGHIHRDGALTRAELTQRLDLSRSTVKALVGDLADLGLVEEVVPSGGERVGRPSHLVAPRDDGPCAIGVDIDVAHVTIATVGLGGVIHSREVITTGAAPSSPAELVRLLAETIPRLADSTGTPGRLCGLGVSVPGTVDLTTGRIGVAPNLGWEDVPFGKMLLDVVPDELAVVVANDADLAVLAEHVRGNARDVDDVVYLLGRIGVGAGILIAGAPVRGRDGHAGEIGHNVLDPHGPPCHCGKRGCIETYLGEAAMLRLAGRTEPRTDEAVATLFADAREGSEEALKAIHSVADPLGRAIANLLNTLNPERVLLGGSIGEVLDIARAEVEASVHKYSFGIASPNVSLMAPALGADSSLLGAAEVAFTDLLADPH